MVPSPTIFLWAFLIVTGASFVIDFCLLAELGALPCFLGCQLELFVLLGASLLGIEQILSSIHALLL